ncbi:hypothetical protein KY359_01415 [Candidatus Woesearchaeota archaeon]|nr:hypothetical protein [Candidatus Woesearchaeota archaeon]
MANDFASYVLYRGRWIREEDWFWKQPETMRLDEEEDLEGELSSEERLSVASPLRKVIYAITGEPVGEYRPSVEPTMEALEAYK